LATLAPKPGEIYADCTAGLGGHAAAIAQELAPGGTVMLNDADASNLERAEARVRSTLASDAGVTIRTLHGNFADLPRRLTELGLAADLVLADLGFSSNQVADAARGFSFSRDGPLDMRLNQSARLSAADLVAGASEGELASMLREYGEEPAATRIAKKVVRARAQSPITTTGRLAEIVREVVGPMRGGIDPATRTFQALRIAVNDELGSLEAFLAGLREGAARAARGGAGSSWLRPGARVAVISFHSLEDRPIKRAFGELVKEEVAVDLTTEVVRPEKEEVDSNPRARSAKLRAIRIADKGRG
jgi:16S rRNA (cytosine1402-N4)-methyltransferase